MPGAASYGGAAAGGGWTVRAAAGPPSTSFASGPAAPRPGQRPPRSAAQRPIWRARGSPRAAERPRGVPAPAPPRVSAERGGADLVAIALGGRKLTPAFGGELPFSRKVLRTIIQEGSDDDDDAASGAPPAESYYNVEASAATGEPLKPLRINMDLALYRGRQARIAALRATDGEERRALLKSAEDALRRCVALDPADARGYVVLGRVLVTQKRYEEARQLYADGCVATGNANAFLWTAWGYLETRAGNVARARKLFDAAIVVDECHAAAWQNWGLLERGQGNYLRARDLWMKGIQLCRRTPQRSNPYLYNSLACLAAELGKTEEARAWFEEGTRTAEGGSSVALWQAWAVMEARQGDATAVRYLFKKALQASPKSRYAHLAWALWERKQGNRPQCIQLLKRGAGLNPTDPALFQARPGAAAAAAARSRARSLSSPPRLACARLRPPPRRRGRSPPSSAAALPRTHTSDARTQAWAMVEREAGDVARARELFQAGLAADPCHLYLYQARALPRRVAPPPPPPPSLRRASSRCARGTAWGRRGCSRRLL